MNDEDMIGLPDEPATDNNQPTPAREPEGALLDNDAEDDTPAEPSGDGEENPAGPEPDEGDPPEVPEPEPTPARPPEPAPQLVADPGQEFTPQTDYSFDIELADGQKIHITKPEDIDTIPQDADFGSPANLMKAQAAMNKMVIGIDQEQREYEANKQKFESQRAASEAADQQVATMISEMTYLENKGELPSVDPKYDNADWTDPEVQKQPGVKERLDLLNYRAEENKARAAAGLPPMGIIEALNQQKLESYETTRVETKNKDAALRKAKGAMVGGGAPTPMNTIPDDVIAGPGGSIRDIR